MDGRQVLGPNRRGGKIGSSSVQRGSRRHDVCRTSGASDEALGLVRKVVFHGSVLRGRHQSLRDPLGAWYAGDAKI